MFVEQVKSVLLPEIDRVKPRVLAGSVHSPVKDVSSGIKQQSAERSAFVSINYVTKSLNEIGICLSKPKTVSDSFP